MQTLPPLDSLPDHLLEDICLYVGKVSSKDFHHLYLLSKTFLEVCTGSYVTSRVSLHGSPFGPMYCTQNGRTSYNKFVAKCAQAENPEAIYRLGCVNFFLERNEFEGRQQLAFAAKNGVQEAQYMYGLILVCLGDTVPGDSKKQGYQLLAPFKEPLVQKARSLWWSGQHPWMKYLGELKHKGQPTVILLKCLYTRDACNCSGDKKGLCWNPGSFSVRYDRFQRLVNLLSSVSCEICLCHHLVQMFFDAAEACDRLM